MRDWISVEERLPERPYVVMVKSSDGDIAEGQYASGKWYFRGSDVTMRGVTHWRPLLAPPKEADERKLLNAAWDKGEEFGGLEDYYKPTRPDRRYRDVSKILKEAEKEKKQDG